MWRRYKWRDGVRSGTDAHDLELMCFKVSIHMLRAWWSYFSLWTRPVPPLTSSFISHIHTYMILYNYIETTNEGTEAVFALLRWGKLIPYAHLQVDPLCFTVPLLLMAENFHTVSVNRIVLTQASVDSYVCVLMCSPSDLWTARHQNHDSNARDLDLVI